MSAAGPCYMCNPAISYILFLLKISKCVPCKDQIVAARIQPGTGVISYEASTNRQNEMCVKRDDPDLCVESVKLGDDWSSEISTSSATIRIT